MKKNRIMVYGTGWCPDCIRAKHFLDSKNAEYEYINIDEDEAAAEKVIEINKGMRSIPTIVFPDGTVLVEPYNEVLDKKLQELS